MYFSDHPDVEEIVFDDFFTREDWKSFNQMLKAYKEDWMNPTPRLVFCPSRHVENISQRSNGDEGLTLAQYHFIVGCMSDDAKELNYYKKISSIEGWTYMSHYEAKKHISKFGASRIIESMKCGFHRIIIL
jgi:hypothetical protein